MLRVTWERCGKTRLAFTTGKKQVNQQSQPGLPHRRRKVSTRSIAIHPPLLSHHPLYYTNTRTSLVWWTHAQYYFICYIEFACPHSYIFRWRGMDNQTTTHSTSPIRIVQGGDVCVGVFMRVCTCAWGGGGRVREGERRKGGYNKK